MEPGAAQDRSAAQQLQETFWRIRKHAWIVVLTAAVAVALTVYFTQRQPWTYASEAKVLVKNPTLSASSYGYPVVNISTESEVARSRAVAAVAAESLGTRTSPDALLGGLSVENPAETDILVFRYVALSPELAQQRAQAFADAYLEYRRESAITEVVQITEGFQARIAEARTQLRSVNDRLTRSVSESESLTLQVRAQALGQQIESLKQQLAQFSLPSMLQTGHVVESAGAASASSPPLTRNGVAALVLGAGLGMAIALLRDRLDRRVRDAAQLSYEVGAPVLAAIPTASAWRKRKDPFIAVMMDPEGQAAESYRRLAANVMFAETHRDVRSILVTSAQAGEGKTATTANLGVALARAGRKVLMVSADLRRPRLHMFFKAGNTVGLSKILLQGANYSESLWWTGITDLRLLPAGPPAEEPTRLLGSPAMESLILSLKEDADIVLIDSPPLLPVADAMLIAPFVDSVLFVADATKTSYPSAAAARLMLDQIDVGVFGAVLNRCDSDIAGPYTHYERRVYDDGQDASRVAAVRNLKRWSGSR